MSALRKDNPVAQLQLPPLSVAKRFLEPEQYSLLEKIVSLREMEADWSVVADVTGLCGTKSDPFEKLRPFLWLLVAVRAIALCETWTEIGKHIWIRGGIAPSTILNKRRSAKLPNGLTLEQFLDEYRQAWERAQRDLLAHYAEEDNRRLREYWRASLERSRGYLDDYDADRLDARGLICMTSPGDPSAPQPTLDLTDDEGRPMPVPDKLKTVKNRVELSEMLARTKRHHDAAADAATKNLRLLNQQSTENVAEVETEGISGLSEEQLLEREARAAAAIAEAERELALIPTGPSESDSDDSKSGEGG
ncbi:hypothetical protein IT575_12135 [bacterium]|nr:hypothetical protein [bacterium]